MLFNLVQMFLHKELNIRTGDCHIQTCIIFLIRFNHTPYKRQISPVCLTTEIVLQLIRIVQRFPYSDKYVIQILVQ